MKQSPGALYIGSGKEGATKIELDDAKAALSEIEADDLVVVQLLGIQDLSPVVAPGLNAELADRHQ